MVTNTVVRESGGGFVAALRVHRSLTASVEKRVLLWMAERAPRGVTSDGLTVLGRSAQMGAGVGYVLARWDRRALVLVIVCIALNWLGDSLDGTLARVRRQHPMHPYVVDFYVAAHKLVVEIDSGVHCGAEARARDSRRDAELGRLYGVRVLRIEAELVEADVFAAGARVRAVLR